MSRYTGAGEPDENHLTGQEMPDAVASTAAAACNGLLDPAGRRDVLTDACVRHAAVQSAERGWFVFPDPAGRQGTA